MKSKRTKACEISRETKEKVYERDGGLCIICHQAGIPNAHYIRRSQGGLGIEQNIVTLCPKCHNSFDNGFKREEYGTIIQKYLKNQYTDWNEKDLIYNKWKNLN